MIGLQAHNNKEVVAALVKSRKGSKKETTRKRCRPGSEGIVKRLNSLFPIFMREDKMKEKGKDES